MLIAGRARLHNRFPVLRKVNFLRMICRAIYESQSIHVIQSSEIFDIGIQIWRRLFCDRAVVCIAIVVFHRLY